MEVKNLVSEEITHYVLFWLKEGLSEQEVDEFIGFFELLRTISTVKSLQYGRAAQTNQRGVVDNSFTYNLIVTFENLQDIGIYEAHPVHLTAIEQYSHQWEKVIVHDSCVAN
jgi:hypothetical protein